MTVAEWIDKHYKPTRLNSESGRRERIIADRERDVRECGYALISHHDCVMGETVIFPEGEAARRKQTRRDVSRAISVPGGSPAARPTVPTQIAVLRETQREKVSGKPGLQNDFFE